MTEQFEIRPAKRERVPLLIGLVGPSGTGKTFSALRLATGIQRVTGGKIAVVDTEARRALAYADHFSFEHLAFGEPFGPLRYLAAGEACIRAGATTVIFDSMSHEHEGPGGVLEIYEKEIERLAGDNWDKRNRMSGIAWNFAKGQRKRMINTFLQLEANLIFCFRAQEKLDWGKGRKNADGGKDKDKGPTPMGWQPITDTHRFMYEMTLQCLLLPGSDGTPTWRSDIAEERAMVKLPKQFRELFAKGPQLSEDLGEKLARWAAGDSAPAPAIGSQKKDNPLGDRVEALLASYAACTTLERHAELEKERGDLWKLVNPETKQRLKAASDSAPIGKTA